MEVGRNSTTEKSGNQRDCVILSSWEETTTWHFAGFSVVLFRSDFVLVSEKNHMKVHKNQWLWDGPYSPGHLSGALSRGHTMVPEGQTPSQRPEMGPPHSDVDLQLLENKALSWGIIRKSAYILAEITIRKSQ